MRAFIIIFIISLIFPQICHGTEYPKAEPNYLLDFSLVAAGIFTQYPLTHSLGHWFGGRLIEKDVKFSSSNIGGWDIEDKEISDQDRNIIGSSGFIFPMIISELALDTPLPKGNPYIIGLVLGPLIHNISYIIQDRMRIKNDEYNDFHLMSKAGLGREITYPIALIIPAIQAWRLISNKDFRSRWDLWMGASEKGANLAMNYKF